MKKFTLTQVVVPATILIVLSLVIPVNSPSLLTSQHGATLAADGPMPPPIPPSVVDGPMPPPIPPSGSIST
jgi:hypothetical protein